MHIATVAVQYGLDVENDLASILPSLDEEPKSNKALAADSVEACAS
jgi:hypothetical protein